MNRFSWKMAALAGIAATAAMSMGQNITVTVDGDPVEFMGAQPRAMDGRVLVPVRGVFEDIGAYVQWHPAQRMVTASSGDRDITLWIGDRTARVNGQTMELDVPAQVINGRTMVPLRFLSESLGATVHWDPRDRQVQITTGAAARFDNRDTRTDTSNLRRATLAAATVIPVSLNTSLSSKTARAGDRFTANVNTSGNYYGPIPSGATVEGHVVTARERSGDQPGILELDFDRLRTPDGRTFNIDGSLISLNADGITRNDDGVLIARGKARDNRMVYAGYGAGAGLLVGLLSKRPLESALLGGILGYLVGVAENDRSNPSDVNLNAGTQFGVRLDRDVVLTLPDRDR